MTSFPILPPENTIAGKKEKTWLLKGEKHSFFLNYRFNDSPYPVLI
jgi:hypothetical protein